MAQLNETNIDYYAPRIRAPYRVVVVPNHCVFIVENRSEHLVLPTLLAKKNLLLDRTL